MKSNQPAILAPVPKPARYLRFSLKGGAKPRAAQESFEPEAVLVRRSMPWAKGVGVGLNFVAFGSSFDAFEAQLKRMVGAEDGITDALFEFTQPVSDSCFWCPPTRRGNLDLRALAL